MQWESIPQLHGKKDDAQPASHSSAWKNEKQISFSDTLSSEVSRKAFDGEEEKKPRKSFDRNSETRLKGESFSL